MFFLYEGLIMGMLCSQDYKETLGTPDRNENLVPSFTSVIIYEAYILLTNFSLIHIWSNGNNQIRTVFLYSY